ncbi:6700_t:CDS:2 [Ambispora leptoticha]|uniref:6700_t:CDS:1 n=1 Tax=Ambispora leptoticha TaxID=144679 RepID=A0A9N9APF8_9GLOM|nr:6700_t:CDS:2 [Ambispora leptoticha]
MAVAQGLIDDVLDVLEKTLLVVVKRFANELDKRVGKLNIISLLRQLLLLLSTMESISITLVFVDVVFSSHPQGGEPLPVGRIFKRK